MATRLRQVALVARELDPVADQLQWELKLGEPFRDPGIDYFGLENAVFAVGDTFVEVVAPIKEGTTAGRYLDKRGGDGGYMALFQVADLDAARHRIADLGVRVVWSGEHDDIVGTHLHPKDVPGAIVSIDWADPPQTWRWAGPAWTGQVPQHPPGGVVGLRVQSPDPHAVGERWAAVLGEPLSEGHGQAGPCITLDDGRQRLDFVLAESDGIAGVTAAIPSQMRAGRSGVTIGGVRFDLVDPSR